MMLTSVRRGAAWLDEVQPDWYARVTRPIRMMDPYGRVASQVFAGHRSSYGFSRSGYGYVFHTYGDQFAHSHGFSGGSPACLWYREIARRQKKAAKAQRKARKRAQRKHGLAA